MNISDKFIIIRDFCKFLQPGLISSTTIGKKLGFPTVNHKRINKLIMDFHWKHLLRTETSRKSLWQTFPYNNKGTEKVKDFPKLAKKKIYFILQSNSTKCNKPFKNSFYFHLIQTSWKGTIFSVLKSGVKTFTD